MDFSYLSSRPLIGPTLRSGLSLKMDYALSTLLLDHSAYLGNLPTIWDKYVVFGYTLDPRPYSQALFESSPEPFALMVLLRMIPEEYCESGSIPSEFTELTEDGSLIIADDLIQEDTYNDYEKGFPEGDSYISGYAARKLNYEYVFRNFVKIIYDAPVVKHQMHVYRTYRAEDMPLGLRIPDEVIKLFGFTSVSYDPELDFGAYLGDNEGDDVLVRFTLAPGVHCLAITPTYHAFPYEHEIVLPPLTPVRVVSARGKRWMDFFPRHSRRLESVQSGPYYYIGEVKRPWPAYVPEVRCREIQVIDVTVLPQDAPGSISYLSQFEEFPEVQ